MHFSEFVVILPDSDMYVGSLGGKYIISVKKAAKIVERAFDSLSNKGNFLFIFYFFKHTFTYFLYQLREKNMRVSTGSRRQLQQKTNMNR